MKVRNNKGVTLIVLTVTVMVLIIITGMLIYGAKSQLNTKKVNNLYNDIEAINSKISEYYLNYDALPIFEETPYINSSNLISLLETNGATNVVLNVNDDENYYVINLSRLENLTLNYGNDFENWKTNQSLTYEDYQDVYIINKVTHQVYYPHGIKMDDELYYAKDIDVVEANANEYEKMDDSNIDLSIITSNDIDLLEKEDTYTIGETETMSITSKITLQITDSANTSYQISSVQYAWSEESNQENESKINFTEASLDSNNSLTFTSRQLGIGEYYLWIRIVDNYGNEYIKITYPVIIQTAD